MRRPAALIFAASFLFILSSIHAQAQTEWPSLQKSTETEKSQNSQNDKSSTKKPGSQEVQQSPSSKTQSSSSDKSAETEKSQTSEKAQSSTPTANGVQKPNPFDQYQHFSASVSGGPMHWDKMKIYRSGKKFRAEYASEKEIRISDLSKRNLSFIRMKADGETLKECGTGKMMDFGSYPFFAYMSSDFNVEHTPTADMEGETETIDGHSCTVENFTVKTKDDGRLINKIRMWRAEDLNGFPTRLEMTPPYSGKKSTFYYSSVSLEAPDPKLFVVPANCPAIGAKAEKPSSSKSKTAKPTTPKANDKPAPPPQ